MPDEPLPPDGRSWLSRFFHESYTGCGREDAAAAAERLLSNQLKSRFKLSHVPIDVEASLGLGVQRIATLEINPDAPGPVIVWAHGAGAGLGWGHRNYDALANLGGVRRRVLAFDWLGQANSTRPSFPSGVWLSEAEYVDSALKFFLESLEAWREALGVETMWLMAHSTGAYVAAHYAMAHPNRVARLVLHGAAGLGSQPAPKTADEEESRGALSTVRDALWGAGFLNFGAIQRLGRFAKEPARERFCRFIKYRSGLENREQIDLLFEYFWTSLCSQPLSSDKWVNAFLVPVAGAEHSGLYGRRPIADAPADKLAALPPTTTIFGERDWIMTPSACLTARELPGGKLFVVPGGFHHLYFDRPDKFHELLLEACA